MTDERTDDTVAAVAIGLEIAEPISAYTLVLPDRRIIGRVDFFTPPGAAGERIIFHTEVDPEFGGRGLSGLLLRRALADSIHDGLTVVPVCPLFARHLRSHGDEYVAEGGAYRMPGRDDIALVVRLTAGDRR
ncbi:N-acetyltransferase [Microbacterium caowuchunii]|uniref:N-acetyltransferase n=1 Tax=Microbacterium caowuchunii TaxID=2614638 RepID=UPI001244FB99|nr:N-acetyltransferase [Microbacterium caowuchunii]QEV99414.1 N-acetyltransferase [Microbacterium caowuchunii]